MELAKTPPMTQDGKRPSQTDAAQSHARPENTPAASHATEPGSRIRDSDFRYVDGKGSIMKSRTELTIAQMLDFLGIEYEYQHAKILEDGSTAQVDFKTDRGLIEVLDGEEDIAKYERIRSSIGSQTSASQGTAGERIMAVGRSKHVARTSEMNDIIYYDRDPQTGSIFLEDPSFAFDYSHILPLVKKCSILHGHTSSVMVELVGQMKNNLLVDFGDAKRIIKDVVAVFDHKFFINEQYVTGQDDVRYFIKFDGPRGAFDLKMPKDTTYLLKGEATVENLASEIIKLLAPRMPENVEAIGVYIYEGYNKGSHIITKIRDTAA